MTRLLPACVATLALGMLGSAAFAETIEREFHESFDVREGMRLHLEHGDGDVSVEPWDRDVLDIEVHYRGDVTIIGFGRTDADFVVDFRERGDEISVIGRETAEGGILIGINTKRRYEYTYTIKAPSYLELESLGEDGEVRIRGWRADIKTEIDDGDVILEDIQTGRVTIEMADGDLEIRGLEAELFVTADDADLTISDCRVSSGRVRMEDGDLEMSDCVGDFDVVVDDGDVRMRSMQTSKLDVRGEDGNIYLELVGGKPDDVNLESDDGRIEVEVDWSMALTFSLASDDGRLIVDAPEEAITEERRGYRAGELNGGGGRLRARSSDGSIRFSVSNGGT